MEYDYSPEDLMKDLQFLKDKGLIEVSGITEDGQWLYTATQKGRTMSQEEVAKLIDGDD